MILDAQSYTTDEILKHSSFDVLRYDESWHEANKIMHTLLQSQQLPHIIDFTNDCMPSFMTLEVWRITVKGAQI